MVAAALAHPQLQPAHRLPIWYPVTAGSKLKRATTHSLTIPIGCKLRGFIRNDTPETIIYVGRVFGVGGEAFYYFTCESGVSGVNVAEAYLIRDYPELVAVSKAAAMEPLKRGDAVWIDPYVSDAGRALVTKCAGIWYETTQTGDAQVRRDMLTKVNRRIRGAALRELPESDTPFVLTRELSPTLARFFAKCDAAREWTFTAPENIKTIPLEDVCWQQLRIA